jgi:hypothetical protein
MTDGRRGLSLLVASAPGHRSRANAVRLGTENKEGAHLNAARRDQVRRALDHLKPYLAAFVGQHVPAGLGRDAARRGSDMQALLRTMLDSWDSAFRQQLPPVARSYVHELIDIRNRWAHEEPFTTREADRAVDTVGQLSALIGVPQVSAARDLPRAEVGQVVTRGRARSQRDVMRAIYRIHGGDRERVLREYAAAERRGEVARKRNETNSSPEFYARALFSDGEAKGWLDAR